MPIMAEHRWLYPIDWPELSKLIRFGRAKGRCEHCQRPHGRQVFHLGDGRWWDADRRHWRDGRGRRARSPGTGVAAIVRVTRVYIACAHLNHDPTDNAPRNLAALCQRCHMIHDAPEHRRRRWLNAYRRRALGDFLAAIEWMPIVAVVDPTTRGSSPTWDETPQVARSDARWAGDRAVPGRAAPDLFL